MGGLEFCNHISCVTSNLAWISNGNELVLTTHVCLVLTYFGDLKYRVGGQHTINSNTELIYIHVDEKDNIMVLCNDMVTAITFIEYTDSTWHPKSIYCSPYSGDLLVGMLDYDTLRGKVIRYNQIGKKTQIIHRDNTGEELFSCPHYIADNINGDIVVSDCGSEDCGAVVVTAREGKHRFSYTGHPSGSELRPRGICIDVMSHILVCDYFTKTIHILSKDGQFLSHIQTKISYGKKFSPCSLCYDVRTHLLLVGSDAKSYV